VVFGDRARLVQVFHNLLDNAMKFGGGGPCGCCARTADEGRVVWWCRTRASASSRATATACSTSSSGSIRAARVRASASPW
jgi:nitrogen-specific signal transduction histidine kinase